jgi:hypothetical protein
VSQDQVSNSEVSKEEVKPEVAQERLTEVTSIADEEKKTGEKIRVPSPEELVARASASLFQNKRLIGPIFGQLSKKATLRALNAIFSLPEDGVRVDFKSQAEEAAFAIGQAMTRDIFLIMQHHIFQKRKEIAEQVAKDQQATQQQSPEPSNEDTTNTQTKETTNE